MTRMVLGRALLWTGLAAVVLAAPARANPVSSGRWPLRTQSRGIDVTTALLMEYYHLLPERRDREAAKAWAARLESGLQQFKANVAGRYAEGTLQRLADHPDPQARRAALLALHLLGTMASNDAVAARLRDDDRQVRQMAADTLQAIWARGGNTENSKDLQKALQQTDPKKGVAALTALIRRSPEFAEAYNQRGVLYFQMQEYDKSAADCEKALRLNARHFGAAAGLGRCYLRLRLPGPALKAFRTAYEINPNLEGVHDVIRDLESVLGGDEK
jgi:tetratricopeptide (TPR) repeat protein